MCNIVKSKVNENSIFLPAAGCRDENILGLGGEKGSYWTSTPMPEAGNNYASTLGFDEKVRHYESCDWRYGGTPVRPVSE